MYDANIHIFIHIYSFSASFLAFLTSYITFSSKIAPHSNPKYTTQNNPFICSDADGTDYSASMVPITVLRWYRFADTISFSLLRYKCATNSRFLQNKKLGNPLFIGIPEFNAEVPGEPQTLFLLQQDLTYHSFHLLYHQRSHPYRDISSGLTVSPLAALDIQHIYRQDNLIDTLQE